MLPSSFVVPHLAHYSWRPRQQHTDLMSAKDSGSGAIIAAELTEEVRLMRTTARGGCLSYHRSARAGGTGVAPSGGAHGGGVSGLGFDMLTSYHHVSCSFYSTVVVRSLRKGKVLSSILSGSRLIRYYCALRTWRSIGG